ncbi:MAG: nitroreductase family protein [Bdellovibrionota bacterium]
MNTTFDAIRERSSIRRFSTAEIPEPLLVELLELANCAPSGFNLQPWHFVLVRSRELKQLLKHIALDQPQASEAPAVVAFAADPNAWKTSYEEVLSLGLRTGQMSQRHVDSYRRSVKLVFWIGPFGIFGVVKKIGVLLRRLVRPTPTIVSSRQDAVQYVRAQTMLAAATFMIAAKAAGLDSSPMEGFDEERLKKLLAIPSSFTVPLLIAVGYPLDETSISNSVRLPLERKLSLDLYSNHARELPRKK